jgi:hypothetical protein
MDFQLPIKLGFDLHVFDKLHIEYQHISYGDVYIYMDNVDILESISYKLHKIG